MQFHPEKTAGNDREKMSREELIAAFSLERVSSAPSQFNQEKLEWLNAQYLIDLPMDKLLPLLRRELGRAGIDSASVSGAWLERLAGLYRERLRTVREFPEKAGFFFGESVSLDPGDKNARKLARKPETREILEQARGMLTDLSDWRAENLDSVLHDFAVARGIKFGSVAQPLRLAVTGGTVSPGIGDTLELLGKERVLRRIGEAVEWLAGDDS